MKLNITLITLVILLQLPYKTISSDEEVKSKVIGGRTYMRRANVMGQEVVFRVVNGVPAALGDIPYQVALIARNSKLKKPYAYEAFCGGSIITPNKIVTAAHCVESNSFCNCHPGILSHRDLAGKYAVAEVLSSKAERAYKDGDGKGQWRKFKSGRYPSKYDFPKQDIAVLMTRRKFVFNEFVSTIPIATKEVDYGENYRVCQISGYGRVNDEDMSDILLVAQVQILDKRLCSFVHRMNMKQFVCSSDLISDVHKGDSGGPLVCWDTGDPNEDRTKGVLVGVVSGKKFGMLFGSFYTRVSSYNSYINYSTKNIPMLYLFLINFVLSLF